jgi:hypothetical protein
MGQPVPVRAGVIEFFVEVADRAGPRTVGLGRGPVLRRRPRYRRGDRQAGEGSAERSEHRVRAFVDGQDRQAHGAVGGGRWRCEPEGHAGLEEQQPAGLTHGTCDEGPRRVPTAPPPRRAHRPAGRPSPWQRLLRCAGLGAHLRPRRVRHGAPRSERSARSTTRLTQKTRRRPTFSTGSSSSSRSTPGCSAPRTACRTRTASPEEVGQMPDTNLGEVLLP